MKRLSIRSLTLALLFVTAFAAPRSLAATAAQQSASRTARIAPTLGSDMVFADWPHILIEGWQDRQKGAEMAEAFKSAGVRSLRFNFSGVYSPRGPEATAKLKAENKLSNISYTWFPFDDYVDFIAANDLTTIIGVNVEEGPDVAWDVVQEFVERGIQSKLVAVELSNEPWLNHRPWLPEEYAARAADVVERLTPLGVKFALPLTVGKERNTPTRLSDDEWNTRMLTAFSSRVALKDRADIYGVLHLYSGGVRAKSIDYFNRAVKPFAPNMRYLVTEFNIRLSLQDNAHLSNEYAMEFARKLAELMARPEIEAMYVHAVPYHSILYWSNGKKLATVSGQRLPDAAGLNSARGWHLTPAGRVYGLYSGLAWDGEVIAFGGSESKRYWAVRSADGRVVVTFLNDSGSATRKKITVAGAQLELNVPARSIVCYDARGQELDRVTLGKN